MRWVVRCIFAAAIVVCCRGAAGLAWHRGCQCELVDDTVAVGAHHLFEADTYLSGGQLHHLCPCGYETVQELNDVFVFPTLDKLRRTPFFRHYRADLLAECPFWKEDGYCMIRDCSVSEDDPQEQDLLADIDRKRDHDTIDETWPDELDSSWTNEAENTHFHFVDLVANPEQYTGYKGTSPHAIWDTVYRYNVFVSPDHEDDEAGVEAMRTEHKVFYKLISGIHASISSHITAQYFLNEEEARVDGSVKPVWGPHLDEHRRRFVSHPHRTSNLHFVYLVVLRALDVSSAFLDAYNYDTGHEDDRTTKHLVKELLSSRHKWPLSLDEGSVFQESDGAELLRQFRSRVYNISRVMDCVGCERCRLWGKLQFMGLGTALRILYAPDRQIVFASLHRNHVVALVNLAARLSHSVRSTRLLGGLVAHEHGDTQLDYLSFIEK